MNYKRLLYYASMIYGILVTLFMLVAFGPKFIGEFQEKGLAYLGEIVAAFGNWYDDPIAFFLTYFIGYAVIWSRQTLGAAIIIIADILFFAFNIQNMGVFIFILPTLLVAILYLLYWYKYEHTTNTAELNS